MINSVMSQGLYGLQKSQNAMAASAQNIAQGDRPAPETNTDLPRKADVDMVSSVVDLKQQQNLFNASAKIIAVANNTMGSLLDATA